MVHGDCALSWSIRHEAREGAVIPVLDDVAAACKAICRAHLPPASGYELTCARLSGPLDGVTITVARANFYAMVSVQGYDAPGADTQAGGRATRLRLIATAHHTEFENPDESNERALARWGISACVAATVGAAAIALQVAGVLATWGYALLLVPALVGTRVCMAIWVADNLRRPSLGASRTGRPQAAPRATAESRDLGRWKAALRELAVQRDVVLDRFRLRPFRGLSPGRTDLAPATG